MLLRFLTILYLMYFLTGSVSAFQMIEKNTVNENFEVEVKSKESYLKIIDRNAIKFQTTKVLTNRFGKKISHPNQPFYPKKLNTLDNKMPRNYNTDLNQKDIKELHYILDTLATRSLFTISAQKSSLKASGDKLNHLHPLKLIACIFTNDTFRAYLKTIRNRSWIWSDLANLFSCALKQEYDLKNLNNHLEDFSTLINLSSQKYKTSLKNEDWQGFIDNLLASFAP